MGTAQGVTVILLLNLINFYQDTSLITSSWISTLVNHFCGY